jgi:F0F1-type ATP synthase delta subunit
MKVSRRKIAQIIASRIEAGDSFPKLAKEIAAYLLTEKRVEELAPLIRDVIEYRASKGIVEATVTSASDLENKIIKELELYIKSIHPETKRVVINKRINRDLIGGLKLNVINDQLDLSIRAKLNRFRELTNQGGV